MKTIIFFVIFLFGSTAILAQSNYSITGLSITQLNPGQIKANLKVHSNSYGEYIGYTTEVNANVITLKACYLTTFGSSVTDIERDFFVEIPSTTGNYVFKTEVYSSYTNACNYQNLDDSATINFSNPFVGIIALNANEIQSPKKDLEIFPIPSSGMINLKTVKKIGNIAVFDSTGRMVLNLTNPENQVNLSHLNNGSYFLEITIGKEKLRERILINK